VVKLNASEVVKLFTASTKLRRSANPFLLVNLPHQSFASLIAAAHFDISPWMVFDLNSLN
jgi:hypothetical protein